MATIKIKVLGVFQKFIFKGYRCCIMKSYSIIFGVFTLFLVLVPILSYVIFPDSTGGFDTSQEKSFILGSSEPYTETSIGTSSNTVLDTTISTNGSTTNMNDTFKVLNTANNQVMNVSTKDYVIGSVCAEMPATFETETIKAQAIVCYTYAIRLRDIQKENPNSELHGADFSNDSGKYQAYYTDAQLKELYGSKYQEYYNKVASAVDEVLGLVITYDDKLIVPVFHSISYGKTEDALVVWGYNIPYLVSVDSTQDTKASSYLDTKTFTPTELQNRFLSVYSNMSFNSDCSKWIDIQSTSEVGTIVSVAVGGVSISGQEFREVLSLRSANFSVSYNGDTFTVTTKGYGHAVGLSQYGANQLAMQGYHYDDILKHYYSGVNIVDVSTIQ